MRKASPEDRACFDYAHRVVIGMSAEDEVVAVRDGISIATSLGIDQIDAADSSLGALIHALAQAMKRHLGGVEFGEVRRDLLAAGMGVKAADRVQYHLVDVSLQEWERLRARVHWYRDDNDRPIMAATRVAGAR